MAVLKIYRENNKFVLQVTIDEIKVGIDNLVANYYLN